jgi:hypothetical protein
MKKRLLLITILFALNTFSQKEANFWYFGRNAGIDFNTSPPSTITNGAISTLEGCSSFSDASGSLLFYTDGIKVWNKDNQIMTYTDGSPADNLRGNPSSTQSGMIIPKPGSSSIYYLFTVGDSQNPAFDLYTIDMSLNGGLGQLIDENNDGVFSENLASQATANSNEWTEKVAAVRGKECNTYWVVTKVSNFFYSYKIDINGVNTTPVISTVNNYTVNSRGYLKLSPDGKKLAIANQNTNNQLLLYSFDNETGFISNDGISIFNDSNDGEAYGVEFSRNSEKLYVSSTSGFRETLADPQTTYKLFQYNLTATDIEGSKTLIHQQIGYRGALQLGPDGKIYATIPLAYDDTNGDATFLDAIENPNADATDVIFTEDAISLGGQKSTQGLPPFISSLLVPVDIKDEDTGVVINDQNLQFCTGDSKTITPADNVTGSSITYEWIFDNGTTTSTVATTATLSLNNLTFNDSGSYTLTIKLTDECGNVTELEGTFNIGVYDAASATKPTDINFCDADRDGFNSFDLQSEATPEILEDLDPNTFDVLYFTSLTAATENTAGSALANPYTNPTAFSTQTIYARVFNKSAPNACYDITEFSLQVTDFPEPVQPTPYRLCDDTASGSDTDGITNNFILSSKDAEILGSLLPAQYNISYHTTLIDAQTSSTTNPIDKNIAYQVSNSQQIYVRVENIDNVACNAISDDATGSTFTSLQLIVDPLPVIKNPNPAEIRQCVVNPNGLSTINLTVAQNNIADNPNGSFEFYEDEAATQQILNYTSYPVDANTNPPKSVWVKTISEFGCSRISELNLIIGIALNEAYDETFIECDDFLDANGNDTTANSDVDGITFFNLDKDAVIANITTNPNIDVFFFETLIDRDEFKNTIDIANYRNKNIPNTSGTRFPIYYKLVNTINNDCTGIGQIYLQINNVPIASVVPDMEECDDALSGSTIDGRNSNINLRNKEVDILGTNQSANDFNVSFHTSQEGATNNTDIIPNDTNYTNEVSPTFTPGSINEQTIYVRVENNTGTNCFNANTSFKIRIQPIPTIPTSLSDLPFCDLETAIDGDSRNRIAQNINLTIMDSEIINGRTGLRVAYYNSQQDVANNNPIADPANFQNSETLTSFPTDFNTDAPGVQTIFVVVVDENGIQCESVFSTFQLFIYPEPFVNPIGVLSECDDANDGDDTNGIIQSHD